MKLDALHELAAAVSAERSVQRVLQAAVEGLCADTSLALARVWLLGPGDQCGACPMRATCPDQTSCLHLEASDGASLHPAESRWRRTNGMYRRMPLRERGFGRVASYGEPMLIHGGEEARDMIIDPAWAEREKIKAFAAQPLAFRGEIFGILGIFSRAPIGASEMRVLRTFANQAAVAIANARAFEEVDRLRLRLEEENRYLKEEMKGTQGAQRLLGASPAMENLSRQIDVAARAGATVLIQGESGTGKELVARLIHERGPRAQKAFVGVNCAAIPRELFESEFFGHAKGAFTGALSDRLGRFALADGGTLFLDEVGEIPPESQAKLLRVIQEGTFERVGEETPRRSNVHLIAATNRDLEEEVYAGQFRADLYYRLNVFPIHVPPLRARLDDLPLLAEHFATDACARFGVSPKPIATTDIDALRAYRWPGNVRELQNVIERAILLAGDGPLDLRHALPHARPASDAAISMTRATASTYDELRELERATVLQALEASAYRVSGKDGAAERLGLKPTTLAYRMRILGIERPRKPRPGTTRHVS